ncbi:MAG: PEP-CTERM sorting domain-containing protein [Pirellula sp.]
MSLWKWNRVLLGVWSLCVLLSGISHAGVLQFESHVTVQAGSSVGGSTLSSDTAVTFKGLFDPADYLLGGTHALYKFSSLQVDIAGVGTYVSSVPEDIGVFAGDASFFGSPTIGISRMTVTGSGYFTSYDTVTQPYDYSALDVNEFSDWTSTTYDVLTIELVGVGDFTFYVSDSLPTTAAITTPSVVPEPSMMAIVGIGGLLGWVRRARRSAKV